MIPSMASSALTGILLLTLLQKSRPISSDEFTQKSKKKKAPPHTLSDFVFPRNDRYDHVIFNPETFSGAPYGGYSRAASSTIASLPLRLTTGIIDFELEENQETDAEPPSIDVVTKKNRPHFNVRDRDGRKFACRVYSQSELSKESAEGSMFDKPELLSTSVAMKKEAALAAATEIPKKKQKSSRMVTTRPKLQITTEDISSILINLKGHCSQVHQGWWSYEWCFKDLVQQFHVDSSEMYAAAKEDEDDPSEENDDGSITSQKYNGHKYTISQVLSLGKSLRNKASSNAGGMVWEDSFEDGDHCEESGAKRKTVVKIQCCESEPYFQKMLRMRRIVNGNKKLEAEEKGLLMEVLEDDIEVCTYVATVCSELVCPENLYQPKDEEEDNELSFESDSGEWEGQSIRKILRTALKASPLAFNAGWWTYEFTHESHVREYHSTAQLDQFTGKTRITIENQHKFGSFSPPTYPQDQEYLHMLNSTTVSSIKSNSTYYIEEYVGGDVCDHKDVTETAMVGTSSEKELSIPTEGIQRSTTVRFSCGSEMKLISVNEDSTCHYIFDVTVPELCRHPLYQVEEEKTNVEIVKCLPVF